MLSEKLFLLETDILFIDLTKTRYKTLSIIVEAANKTRERTRISWIAISFCPKKMTEIKKTNNPICTIILFISSSNFLLRSAKNIPPDFRAERGKKVRKWKILALILFEVSCHLVIISHVFDFGTDWADLKSKSPPLLKGFF